MQHQTRTFSLLMVAGLVILAAAVYFSSCGHVTNTIPQHDDGRIFTMNIGTEPPTLDPVEADDMISISILTNIYRGLTQYGPNNRIVPAYAQSWQISPDGRTYTFHLRKNGRWSDGKPVTANDFVYGWRRVLDPKNGSPYAFLLFDIENARAFYEGQLSEQSALGIKALDDTTLQVRLERPVAFFLQIMAFSISLPQRQDIIERYGDRFTEAKYAVSNGPYLLGEWRHENQIMLKPNPKYFNGAPQNDGVRMYMIPEPNTSLIMYENNELDFVETPSSLPVKEVRRLKNRPDYHQKTLNGISYMGFNTRKKPFDDIRVRKAFIHAFDRQYIPKLFQGGEQIIQSWITPGLTAYNPAIGLPFDLEKARQYLAKAGYPNGKGFPRVEMLYANTSPEVRQMAEIAQYQWQENLGVQVDLKTVEWKVFLKELDDDPPPIFRLQWYVDYPDPDSFMTVFISESGNNFTRWTSKTYDRLVREAATAQTLSERQALYDQAQRLLLEEAAAIMPLYVIPKSYLLKPDVLGFELNELNLPILDNVHFQK